MSVLAAACGTSASQSPDAGGPDASVKADSGPLPPEVVRISPGLVRGKQESGVYSFKGIPYAKPPVGVLRWKRPAPIDPWTGEKPALEYGAKCVQQSVDKTVMEGGQEDCLTLNVWTPNLTAPKPGLPVMVYIHGGFNARGSSSEELDGYRIYQGDKLARNASSVVVTMNYRVGAFGFLTHPALAKENAEGASGNYGNLDQIAALSWVQANIAAFGGDPQRVMLFGQSAGSVNTCVLIASPLAKGLFSRAVMHSGLCPTVTREKAEATGVAVAKAVGCDSVPDVPACLRGKPIADLAAAHKLGFTVDNAASWSPTVDGYTLPDLAWKLIDARKHNDVPLIVSVTAHEPSTLWSKLFAMTTLPKTSDEYAAAIRKVFGKFADQVLGQYPATSYSSPAFALIMAYGDASMVCPSRNYSRLFSARQTQPVRRFFYSHIYESGPLKPLGAGHGLEIPLLFGHFPPSSWQPSPNELALSSTMVGYWARLAATGDPNGANAPSWPIYDVATDPYLELNTTFKTGTQLSKSNCDFWDTVK